MISSQVIMDVANYYWTSNMYLRPSMLSINVADAPKWLVLASLTKQLLAQGSRYIYGGGAP